MADENDGENVQDAEMPDLGGVEADGAAAQTWTWYETLTSRLR